MEDTSGALQQQIEQTRNRVKSILFSVFNYSDETRQKIDPTTQTLKTPLLEIYNYDGPNAGRLVSFLQAIDGVVGDGNQYEEEKLSTKSVHNLRILNVVVRAGDWLLNKATDEDFSSFVEKVKADTLPKSLTSDNEIKKLTEKFTVESYHDSPLKLIAQTADRLTVLATAGEDKTVIPALDVFLKTLENTSSLDKAIERVSMLT